MGDSSTQRLPITDNSSGGTNSIRSATDVAKAGGAAFVGKVLGTGLRYLTQVFIASFLGAGVLGIYSIGMAFCQLLEIVAAAGLHYGSVRFIALHRHTDDIARLKGVILSTMRVPLVFGALVGGGLHLTADLTAVYLFEEPQIAGVLRLFAVAIPFGAAMSALAFASTGFEQTKYLVYTLYLIHPSLNLIALAVLVGLGFGVEGTAAAWLLAGVGGFVAAVYFIWRLFPSAFSPARPAVFEEAKLIAFSAPLMSGGFLWVAVLWTDILMLGYFTSAMEVGVYRAASQTALLTAIVVSSINAIFTPKFANLHLAEDTLGAKSMFQLTTRWSVTFTTPIVLVLALGAEGMLRIFGQEFRVGAPVLLILALGQLVNAATGGVASILMMSGRHIQKMISDAALIVSNVVLNLLLIPKYGILGAAIATSASTIAAGLLRLVQVYYFLRIQPYDVKFLWPAIAAVAATVVTLVAQRIWTYGDPLSSLVVAVVGVSTVYPSLLLACGLDETDRAVLREFLPFTTLARRANP